MKYGPSRGELWFRLIASVFGLGFVGVAIALRGVPSGPAFFELILLGGGFFVALGLFSARSLLKTNRE